MQVTSKNLLCASIVAAAAFGASRAQGQTIDGTLSPSDGYSLLSTQTNVTASPSSEGGGASGPGNEVAANNTADLDQLSNAYGAINQTTQTLNLFLGGSLGGEGATQGTDVRYFIPLETAPGGSTSLAGLFGGNFGNITFDNGFAPNIVIEVTTSIVGQTHADPGNGITTSTQAVNPLQVTVFDTTVAGTGPTSAVTAALNNALQTTAVGAGSNIGFSAVKTGLELSIPLATTGYVPDTSILASAFFDIGSDTRTTNQVLSPFTYNAGDTSGGYDYTYVDSNEGGNPAGVTGRQFTGVDYPGNQFFVIGVPEPTSLGMIGLVGGALIRRRARKA